MQAMENIAPLLQGVPLDHRSAATSAGGIPCGFKGLYARRVGFCQGTGAFKLWESVGHIKGI